MEWPPCASPDSGRVPCTLARAATGAGAATLAAEAATEGVREREKRRAGERSISTSNIDGRSIDSNAFFFTFGTFFLSLPLLPWAPCPTQRRARRRIIALRSRYNFDQKYLRFNQFQLQFDARRPGSSRVVAGGVVSAAAPTSSSSSSTATSSASCCYDEELYFRGRTVLSSACGVTTKRYTCSEEVVAVEYCSFASNSSSSSPSSSSNSDDHFDFDDDSDSRGSSGSPDESLAVVCESSVVCLRPGEAAIECPLDRGGRDKAWRLPRGCGLLLSSSSSASSSSSSASSASPAAPAPVVLSHPMEEPATLPAIRYCGAAEGEKDEVRAELGDLAGESVLFVGRLSSSSSSSSSSPAPFCRELGDRVELRDSGWFAVTTRRSDEGAPSSASGPSSSSTTTLWALSRCSAKGAAAAPETRSLLPGAAPPRSNNGAFAATPGGGPAAAAAAQRGTPRTPAAAANAGAASLSTTAAATAQQLGLSPTAAATTHAAALAAATAGKGRR